MLERVIAGRGCNGMKRPTAIQRDTDTAQSIYRAAKTVYRIAGKQDDTRLRDILRNTPMTSWLTLSSEHEPDYFASASLFGQRETLIAERNDDPHQRQRPSGHHPRHHQEVFRGRHHEPAGRHRYQTVKRGHYVGNRQH